MLSKLLRKDLSKNMRWLWILFAATILTACVTRGCKELGENIAFFRIIGIFFDSVFYALAVNVILHPFLRNFLNFTKSFYSDESYLTHTLPVTKNDLINSKYITAITEIVLGFVTLVACIFIMFYSSTFFTTLNLLLSTIIAGSFSTTLVLILFIVLVIVEFLMFISIIFFSIVIGYRSREKKVLKSFLFTALMSFAAILFLSFVLIIVLLINGVELSSTTLVLDSKVLYSVILSGIVVYSAIILLFYFLTKREFNKGVNVD